MGSYHNYHIGPVVTATIPEPTLVQEEKKGCPKCKVELSSAFCAKCGTAKDTYQVNVNKYPNYYDIFEDDPDVLVPVTDRNSKDVPGNVIAWCANQVGWSVDLEETDHVNLLGRNLQEECDRFAAKYAKEIEILKKHYNNVQVNWGIYSYYS